MTRYIKNELGGVHTVDDEHVERFLTAYSDNGRPYLKHGITEITEEEARELHPQLFGAPDEQVTYTDNELNAQIQRKRMLDDLFGPRGA
jgi:hypothetical protein